jgi:hypothetical protein
LEDEGTDRANETLLIVARVHLGPWPITKIEEEKHASSVCPSPSSTVSTVPTNVRTSKACKRCTSRKGYERKGCNFSIDQQGVVELQE